MRKCLGDKSFSSVERFVRLRLRLRFVLERERGRFHDSIAAMTLSVPEEMVMPKVFFIILFLGEWRWQSEDSF